nr:NADH dehydrogenase subunit 6 [Zoodes fulguratus]
MNFTLICLMALSFLLVFIYHPLSFSLILLTQTFLISVLTGLMNYNFWFSYILFLVMVGGILILFIYMTSIASNEKFKFSMNLFIFFWMIVLLMLIIQCLIDSYFSTMNLFNHDITFMENYNLSMNKYMNFPLANLMILMITYLLIALIMVVKITESKQGPLRQKF